MEGRLRCRFDKNWDKYSKGEVAGFPKSAADALAEKGILTVLGPVKPQPKKPAKRGTAAS